MYSQTKVSQFLLGCASLVVIIASGSQKPGSAQITSVSQVSSSFSLKETNGQKIVAGPSGLHTVFVSGGNVRYLTSPNAVTWSAPVALATVATNASHPTIAVAGNTVGVAYHQGNSIFYKYKLSTGGWSTAVQITGVGGTEPAMVGYGSKMYLTWNSGSGASYSSFTANSPAGAPWEGIGNILTCGNTTIFKPAVAVMPSTGPNSLPMVRVAFFYRWTAGLGCAQPTMFGLQVFEKKQALFTLVKNSVGQTTGNPYGVSLSVAANSSTGEFYLGASQVDVVGSTFIGYQDAWNNGQWLFAPILQNASLIDVAAASCSKFRIAVSDVTGGNGTYGPTWYRTGQWAGAIPAWAEPTGVQVSSLGRDPQALFWSSQSGLINREIHAMFEENSGPSYFVRHDVLVRSGRILYDCRIRDTWDETRGSVAQARK